MKKILLVFSLLFLVFLVSACGNQSAKKNQDVNLDVKIDSFLAYLIKDSRCTEGPCQTEILKQSLNQIFPNLEFVEYDYKNDPEGEKFYNDYQLTVLPALLLTKAIEAEENYPKVQNYLKANAVDANLLSLSLGASFNPNKEICNNNIDDTGNGKVDCEDANCQGDLFCRTEEAKTLDLFVMSQCPYGTKALDAMEEVIENFGDQINFRVNFIANKAEDGFKSLHGQPEVDENIRELCAIEYYPDDYEYMDYIWCRNKDIMSTDWQTCATNFPKIKTCFTGEEGAKLLEENIKLANTLGIGASPTWLTNNRYKFSGITSEAVRQNFCQYNTDLEEDVCKVALSNESNVPAGECN